MTVQTRVTGSVLEYLDDVGRVIMAIDGAQRKVYVASGASADFPAGEIATADLAAASVTKAKLAGSFLKFVVKDGQDEATPAITVTGIAVGDELVFFGVLASKASIATLAARALTDFTITADTLTVGANAANNASNQYFIVYLDLT